MKNEALIIVDVQRDFIDGPMKVPGAERVVPVINDLIPHFKFIVATKDWHPFEHSSFKENGGKWPRHCIMGTDGAKLHSDLKVPSGTFFIQKGTQKEVEQYSAFSDVTGKDNGLQNLLRKNLHIDTVYICGLTTDYCVLETALDSAGFGFKTNVILNACKEVDEDTCRQAHKRMTNAGIVAMRAEFDNTEVYFKPIKINENLY